MPVASRFVVSGSGMMSSSPLDRPDEADGGAPRTAAPSGRSCANWNYTEEHMFVCPLDGRRRYFAAVSASKTALCESCRNPAIFRWHTTCIFLYCKNCGAPFPGGKDQGHTPLEPQRGEGAPFRHLTTRMGRGTVCST